MAEDEFAPPVVRRRMQAERARRRRRVLVASFAAGLVAFVIGAVIGATGGGDRRVEGDAGGPIELPRGGRSLLPEYRLVGLYGAPQHEALGALGVGTPAQASERLVKQARAYQDGRKVMPVFELIATIASAQPGEDGLYRTRQPHSVIQEYLEAA